MKHTLTTTYQLYDGSVVPVDITFRHYPEGDRLEFIWANVDTQQYPAVASARFRIIIERWAAHWLQDHHAEALALAKGLDEGPRPYDETEPSDEA